MSAPSGWYPDPQTPVPGAPAQQRYWDGQAWTEHVAPITPPSYAQQAAFGQASYPQAGYVGAPAYALPPTTPDGVPLAGWWQRAGAVLIDFLVLAVITILLTLPLIRDMFNAFGDYFDASMTAAENGTPAPSSTQFQSDVAGPLAAVSAISLALSFVYNVGFLVWKQATLGKLVLGLRVRLRERPELPVPTVLIRWAVQSGVPGLLAMVPFVGAISGLFTLLNSLWPLWDDKRQAIHDKVAKTNVVRIR